MDGQTSFEGAGRFIIRHPRGNTTTQFIALGDVLSDAWVTPVLSQTAGNGNHDAGEGPNSAYLNHLSLGRPYAVALNESGLGLAKSA